MLNYYLKLPTQNQMNMLIVSDTVSEVIAYLLTVGYATISVRGK